MLWNRKSNKNYEWSYLTVLKGNSILVYTLKNITKNGMIKKSLIIG